jgi:hypothetical protein
MKRHIILAIIAFMIAFVSVSLVTKKPQPASTREDQEVHELLRREAELVSYFCLSRIPPVYGTAAIPSEWEKALGSTVRLREGIGEVTREAPEFAERAGEIQNLKPGQSIALTSQAGGSERHWIIFKPTMPGNQLLVVSKSATVASRQLHGESKLPSIVIALLAGVAAALIQLVVARILFPPARKES